MKGYNSALIGCGRIGFFLNDDSLRKKPCTHFHGAQSAGINFNFFVDNNSDRLETISSSENISPESCFSSHNDLFKNHLLDMVTIATWTSSHDSIAISAAENGVKTIVLEKPIASDLKKAQKIIDACKQNDTTLFINHERRYDPRYIKAKAIIEKGTIGEVKTVYASVLTGPYRGSSYLDEGGGSLLHDGTHLIDVLRFFFGDFASARGSFSRDSRKKGFEDRASAWLKSHSGIDIFLESGGSRKYFTFEIVISGTEGKLVIGNGYEKLYTNNQSRFYKGFRDLKSIGFPRFSNKNYFTNLYQDVKKSLGNDFTEISSSGYDGYKALEVIHGIYHSAYNNEKTIKFPLNNAVNLKKIFDI